MAYKSILAVLALLASSASAQRREPNKTLLASAVTTAATLSVLPTDLKLDRYTELIITLDITSAERDSANETYDFYITTGNGVASWDVAHFSQIATTGAKTFIARVRSDLLPQTVTTAAPGVSVVASGTLATVTGGTNATKSLGVGLVMHGPWGSHLGYELVIAGTVVTGITYSIRIDAR